LFLAICFGALSWGPIYKHSTGEYTTGEAVGMYLISAAAFVAGGAVASYVTPMAGLGFYGGAFTGAMSEYTAGFIQGAGSTWVMGGSFSDGIKSVVKSGIIGGLIGGIIGGMSGGITAVKHGGSFWTGKGATFNFTSTFQVEGKSDPVEYSTKSAKEFSKRYIGDDPKGLNDLFADGSVPEGYKLADGGYALSPDGEYAQGVTQYLGGGKADVYLFEAGFKSHEQLYLVMQHEYMHVTYFNTGLMNYNKQEAGARQWMLEQGKAWNYKVDKLQIVYDQTSPYLSNKYHYSVLGINILNTTPW